MLVAPIDFAGQGDPAILDLHTDGVAGHSRVPFQAANRRGGNVLVAVLDAEGQPDLDFLGNRLHVLDPSRGCLGRGFFGIGLDMPRQRHDAVFRRYADMSGIHARLPAQFVEHGLFQLLIVRHGFLLG